MKIIIQIYYCPKTLVEFALMSTTSHFLKIHLNKAKNTLHNNLIVII